MPTGYDPERNTITVNGGDSTGGLDYYRVCSSGFEVVHIDPSDMCKMCKTRHCNSCFWDPTVDAPKKKEVVSPKISPYITDDSKIKSVPWAWRNKLHYITTTNNEKWKYMKKILGEWIVQEPKPVEIKPINEWSHE